MFLLPALLLAPPALADVPPDTSAEEDTAAEEDDKGCTTAAVSASLLGISVAAAAVGWRRRED